MKLIEMVTPKEDLRHLTVANPRKRSNDHRYALCGAGGWPIEGAAGDPDNPTTEEILRGLPPCQECRSIEAM